MPADRLLHPRLGHSDKVSALNDLEARVWIQFLLSADDFGIMRASALTIQADNDALAKRRPRLIESAIDRLIAVGLVLAFEHQGRRYALDPLWQRYQKIDYPKQTIHPLPPPDILDACHPLTQELFRQCFGKPSTKFRVKDIEDSEKVPGEFIATRAHAQEEAQANGKELTAKADPPRLPQNNGVMSGALPRDHLKHAACDPTHSRCVPIAVHDKLANALAPRHGGDRQAAKNALLAWYPSVWRSLPADFVMSDAFKFWQIRFDAAFASKVPATPPGVGVPSARQTATELDADRQRIDRMVHAAASQGTA